MLFDTHTFDQMTRRTLMKRAAQTAFGVSIVPFLSETAQAQQRSGKNAKHVIYLFMTGAMSHLDTFDPKPGREVQGETKSIRTKVPSIQISEYLPKLAQQMNRLAIVRSLNTETGDHQGGRYLMRTSYKSIATTRHPGMGAWVQELAGPISKTLPGNVLVGGSAQHPGAGFLRTKFSPVPVGDPDAGLQNTKGPAYLKNDQFEKRMKLINKFDQGFQKKYKSAKVDAYSTFYEETVKLLKSEDLKAFDLNQEDDKLRDTYGRNKLGQGCLLARRLVEKGVRFIEVAFGNWDHHNDLWNVMPERAGELDQALSALLNDLQSKGLLDETLVVVATEFGRKPKINQNAGRDHHPGAFSGVLAGGGIKGGQVWGASDEDGHSALEDPVMPEDFNATIAKALGLPLKQEVFSPDGRPFKVAHDGAPMDLF